MSEALLRVVQFRSIHGVMGIVFALWTLSACAQMTNQSLGTLLYSPAERGVVVASRKGETGPGETSGITVTVNGIVARNGKRGTSWINGRPLAEGESLIAGGELTIQQGRVMIDGKSVRVRGMLELETGVRTEVLPQGAVTVRRVK